MVKEYNGYKDLRVYQVSYALAMDIFRETKSFPVEEKYSMIDQIRRSSRSVPAQISEAWKKRVYQKAFVSKLTDCSSEAAEVQVWLDMSHDCGYLSKEKHQAFSEKCNEISRMLFAMIHNPEKFCH